jgi:lipopolysaccharide transport system permease protein
VIVSLSTNKSEHGPPAAAEGEGAHARVALESLPLIRIQPSRGWVGLRLEELWAYRELLYFLIWRDIKVRYKQTALGATWAIIQPVMTMIVFTVVFGNLAKLDSDGVPYTIFTYAALLPWTLFSNGLTSASNSLVAGQNLITKVYFPRLVLPISSVVAGLVDFAIASVILAGMLVYYEIVPTWNVVFLPLFILLALVTALGVGLWLAALNVRFRDVRYVVPFIVQFWLFATPIAYSSTLLSDGWRTVAGINPMVGVVEGFRWALIGTDTGPGPMVIVSTVTSLVILVAGAMYFRRLEKSFADIV